MSVKPLPDGAEEILLQSGKIEDPEVVLMLRVRAGDDGAFAELVQRYWSPVFGRFYRRLGHRQEAEDLAQDVFMRVYRSRSRYQPRARFATWIYHIAGNVARNALRSRRRRACQSLAVCAGEEDVFSEQHLCARQENPAQPLERQELAGVVRTAVSGLAERQRRALELHQFQDRTYSQVAAELRMTPKAAKSLLYRARNQLRVTLEPFMDPASSGAGAEPQVQ